MEVGTVNSLTQDTTSRGTQALEELGEDYSTFLKLLTAQISNQDPLEPIDSTTFVTQLAQLTQVEQAAQTNVQLENLGAKFDAMALMSGSSLLGQRVSFSTNTFVLDETGASASYQLGTNARKVTAEIYSPSGLLIRTITDLPWQAGTQHEIAWDGLSDAGQSALRGTYKVIVRAEDDFGKPAIVSLSREADIQEVKLEAGVISYLVDGGEYITPPEIQSIR